MQDRTTDPLIDVNQLAVGMFIHLDLGWMSHSVPAVQLQDHVG
jgi:hypothetical protein